MLHGFEDMTEERFWELFTLFLVEPSDTFVESYRKERLFLLKHFGPRVRRISHVGSTAIKGILTKPCVDIIFEIDELTNLKMFMEDMVELGYMVDTSRSDLAVFCKGYTTQGYLPIQTHIHVRYFGDPDELYFRDYLNEFPDVAKRYEKLKVKLIEEFRHDRNGYTVAKLKFKRRIVKLARAHYGPKYK